ncbi:MAG TPA: LptA/OstA family protein [Candidatus Dormibacteraeota bacterium]|nr:LptA/OstA family protein [Candidatus Dormibacteraeota bacterium]
MIRPLTAAIAGAIVAAAVAASPTPAPSAYSDSFAVGIWTVHTSSLDFNQKSGDFSVPTKLLMTRQGGDVEADRANGNYKTQIVTLYGDVTMHDQSGNFAGMASGSITHPSGPATLTADQIRIDGKTRVYVATGHVHYVQENTTVDAERGMLNDASHMLYLSGNARVAQGLRNVVADRIAYDTVTGNAHAEGNVTMQFPSEVQPHIATPKPIRIPGLHTPHP